MIDVTITATHRHKLLDKTLSSFALNSNLFELTTKAIVNIDPVGVDHNHINTVDVVSKHLHNSDYINRFNAPPEPSFPKAFKWCWSTTTSKYVFNLEDDWELLQHVDFQEMIDVMESEPDLASLRLPFKPQDKESMKNWKYFFPAHGKYYECPDELKREVGFCGHPSLLRGDFVRACEKLLYDTSNPEKQFHQRGNPPIMLEVDKWRFGVWKTDGKIAVKDIGREWMVKNGFQKKGTKAFFQEWERVEHE